jgi:uncharacterized protein YndB with AHSA1/START domain
MPATTDIQIDPKLDLVLERYVDVPVERVWSAWTEPQHILKWFTPAPWSTVDCRIDLRPGGEFYTVMRSPEGADFPNTGCILQVVPNERLVWTSALQPGYRPTAISPAPEGHECAELLFTAFILLEAQGTGTRYTAIAMHPDELSQRRHAEMGFHEGWGKCLDQLVEVMSK